MAIVLGALVKQKECSLALNLRKSLPHSDTGEFTDKPKNAQEPQDHGNDYDSIQDRLNGARHRDV
jgi:hypothetical protein